MNFSISPKVSVYLNIAYMTLTALTAPALEAAGVSHGDAMHVVGAAALLAIPLNIILHSVSSPTAGPAVSTKN
jgi:hypothetical protein